MDQYDRIIDDVRRKTDDEVVRWKVVNADRHSDILLNSYRVVRAFHADYTVGVNKYDLLFVQRKINPDDDFGDYSEGYAFELFVLDDDDGEIVFTLREGVVDRDDLLRLSGSIEAHNDRAKRFFEAFDQSGAA